MDGSIKQVNTRNLEEGILTVKEYLERGLEEFGANRNSSRWIRDFADKFPNLFSPAALSLLRHWNDSQGQRFLASLLLGQPNLLKCLVDPWRLTRAEAVTLFNRLLALERALDVRLARCLPDREGISPAGFTPAMFHRALEILDETSQNHRVAPILQHLVDYPEERISSKATLVVGRRLKDPEWALKQMKIRRDHRLRANALEALWGVDSGEARELMHSFSRDENNRVAATALYGRYLLQGPSVEIPMLEMAKSAEPNFRCSAAWLLGKTQNQELVPRLNSLMHDESQNVRRSALKALLSLRRVSA